VAVALHLHAGAELVADHPESGVEVDLQELQRGAVTEVDEGELLLAAVEGLRDAVEDRHGAHETTPGRHLRPIRRVVDGR
jgi:hypothetical protein